MARVLVLGAGFGGIAAATRLRALLGNEDEVVLVDRRADFVMGLRKTWAILGSHPIDEGTRPLSALRELGIDVRQGAVEAIEPAARRVRIDGEWLDADAIVVALGAQQAPEAIPGLVEHGINVWDRANAGRAHDALAALDRGRLLVGVFGTPYACPPGPFELALLAREALTARGADASVEVFGPMPIALPVVGPVQSGKVEGLLDAAGIAFHRGTPATSVDRGVVHLADGRDLPFDLLLAVPPHRVPQVLVDAGIAQPGGWVEVDRYTLATPFPGVYAVGDTTVIKLTHGLPLPKAGLFAEAEGYAVAERVAAELAGRESTAAFDGSGLCYAETGAGQAVEIQAHFYADPPGAEIVGPSAEAMTGKLAFEAERLAAWFGGVAT
jgi:sulfide:quinone oxidoreductase